MHPPNYPLIISSQLHCAQSPCFNSRLESPSQKPGERRSPDYLQLFLNSHSSRQHTTDHRFGLEEHCHNSHGGMQAHSHERREVQGSFVFRHEPWEAVLLPARFNSVRQVRNSVVGWVSLPRVLHFGLPSFHVRSLVLSCLWRSGTSIRRGLYFQYSS